MAGGGAERQLSYLAEELMSRGWEAHVALIKEGSNYDALVSTGCRIHKIPCLNNHDVTILIKLIGLIRKIRPQLVQTWMLQMDVLGGLASRLAGVPFILSERNCSSAYLPTIKNRLRAFIGRFAAAIVSNSIGGDTYWQTLIGSRVPTFVVSNGLPLDKIAMAQPPASGSYVPQKAKVLLFAGRFSPQKNLETIIEAFDVVSSRKNAVLLLCGEGELRPRIEGIVRRKGLASRVMFLGYTRNVWELMTKADLFISVSKYEGRPNVVLEAMACGCPLILSDIPAHREFLQDGEAVFVDPGSAPDIARAIVSCFEDREVGRQAALKAKAGVSSYSIPAMADQYENIYRAVISGSQWCPYD